MDLATLVCQDYSQTVYFDSVHTKQFASICEFTTLTIMVIIITITTTIFIVMSSTAPAMPEFTVVHLGQSRSAPGGRQLVGQAANLTFESACRLL